MFTNIIIIIIRFLIFYTDIFNVFRS